MASIPFRYSLGQNAANVANTLLQTIQRRNELQSQGKLAELRMNMAREERKFAAETQRLRDVDYQKFQERDREDRQKYQKERDISNQIFTAGQNKLQRQHDFELARKRALQAAALKQQEQELMMLQYEYATAKTEAQKLAKQNEIREKVNTIQAYRQPETVPPPNIDAGLMSSLPGMGVIGDIAKLFKSTPTPRGEYQIDPNDPQIYRLAKDLAVKYFDGDIQKGYEALRSELAERPDLNPALKAFTFPLLNKKPRYQPGELYSTSPLKKIGSWWSQAWNPPVKFDATQIEYPYYSQQQFYTDPTTNELQFVGADSPLMPTESMRRLQDAYGKKVSDIWRR